MDIDVEAGDEGETAGPVPTAAKGRLDLEPASFCFGRSSVTEDDLDKYVRRRLLSSPLRSWC